MRLLPVIDLMQHRVVRAVAGRRNEYGPWDSPLVPSGEPALLARNLRERFGFVDAYVADLDAIQRRPLQLEALHAIGAEGLSIWLDAGTGTAQRMKAICDLKELAPYVVTIVVGLESLESPNSLANVLREVPAERIAFSLDLHEGLPWTRGADWNSMAPMQIARLAWSLGIRRLIVLDVARVGTGTDVGTRELCAELRAEWPEMELIAGGGVRDGSDVKALADAGCDRVLVATALHTGRLTPLEVLQNVW